MQRSSHRLALVSLAAAVLCLGGGGSASLDVPKSDAAPRLPRGSEPRVPQAPAPISHYGSGHQSSVRWHHASLNGVSGSDARDVARAITKRERKNARRLAELRRTAERDFA